MRTRGRFPNRRRKSPLSRECWVPSSTPICSTSVTLRHLRPESPASEAPARLTALSSPASLRPTKRESLSNTTLPLPIPQDTSSVPTPS